MSHTLRRGEVVQLPDARYCVAISWDRVGSAVDLDLQAVVVDTRGFIIDAVYYNNLEAMGKAIMHSGDSQTGDMQGFDEMIWVKFPKLPDNVALIIFVVAAHSGGHLRDVIDARVSVLGSYQGSTLAQFKLENSIGDVDAVVMMKRAQGGRWALVNVKDCALEGSHFMDILEPTLGDLIRSAIPSAPKRQRVDFKMKKGSMIDLPNSVALKRVYVGVGWDMKGIRGEGVDLDVSAVFFHEDGRDIGAVYFDNVHEYGVRHTGDNLTGAGEGDDEVITVDLIAVPQQVAQIFFIVNIYSKDATFASLNNAYCRVLDSAGSELVRYALGENSHSRDEESGLIISRLFRKTLFGRWGFQAIGSFCHGRTWMDSSCISEMKRLFHTTSTEIQMRGGLPPPSGRRTRRTTRRDPTIATMSKVNVPIKRGAKIDISQSLASKKLFVGVGWDLLPTAEQGVDLDVSAVFFHEDGRDIGAVCFDNTEEYGVQHSGDNVTGEGDGDDEVISVDLTSVPPEVAQVFFVVNVYTKGTTFGLVQNAHCRVVDEAGHELVFYALDDLGGSDKTGLIISQFYRKPDAGWSFHAHGTLCRGRSWMDPLCVNEMKRLFRRTARSHHARSSSPAPRHLADQEIDRAIASKPGQRIIVSL